MTSLMNLDYEADVVPPRLPGHRHRALSRHWVETGNNGTSKFYTQVGDDGYVEDDVDVINDMDIGSTTEIFHTRKREKTRKS